MKYSIYIILFFCMDCLAQQTPQYTQFTFNKYGYNPAAAGVNMNSKLEIISGTRTQWIGFDHSPSSNFFSANYTFKPQRSYKRWHNTGVYINQDNAGLFQNIGFYGSYTVHIPLTNKLTASFGIFAGIKRFSFIKTAISSADPVYATSASFLYSYPDFIPGIRLYNKKMFFDISLQQLYKNRQAQGNKKIGSKSLLVPQLYTSFGKKIYLNPSFTIVPTIHMHTSYYIPNLELNVMAYYNKRIGLGMSIRNRNFLSTILQVRIMQHITAGFAYDYSINKLRQAVPSTVEFMIGITPILTDYGRASFNRTVAKCPDLDF